MFNRPIIVYIGISQGLWGYLRDLGFLIPSVLLKKKVIIHLRGSEFLDFYKRMNFIAKYITKYIFKRASKVVVLSDKLKFNFSELVRSENIVTIPNGVNFYEYDMSSGISFKKEFKIRNILFLSSLKKRKGIHIFLKALPDIFKKYNEINVVIAGGWKNIGDREQAMEIIRKNEMEDKIIFLGEIQGIEKIKTYQNSDLFVFPPVEPEGMPWVLLEAMSARLPVITTAQGAISDVVEDGVTGYLVDPIPEEISKKICYFVDNPLIARQMGENGRKRVEEKFSRERYLSLMEDLFSSNL